MQHVMFFVCLRIKRPVYRHTLGGRGVGAAKIKRNTLPGMPNSLFAPLWASPWARPCRKLCLYIEAILLIFNIK